MNRIVVCLDCPEYQKGGYCQHKRKEVGALDNACEHAQKMDEKFGGSSADEVPSAEQPETTKKCTRCGEVLPLASFDWVNYKGTRKRRRICSKCYHEAMKKEGKKNDGMKVCNGCHRELPLSEFYERGANGHSFLCKECARKYNVERTRQNRERKMAEMNAGATTKVCKSCGRELPLDAFGGHAKTWDKKNTVCLECMAAKLRKNVSKVKKTPDTQKIVVREVMTDEQMVAALRANGWEVTCRKMVHLEL